MPTRRGRAPVAAGCGRYRFQWRIEGTGEPRELDVAHAAEVVIAPGSTRVVVPPPPPEALHAAATASTPEDDE